MKLTTKLSVSLFPAPSHPQLLFLRMPKAFEHQKDIDLVLSI